MQCDTQNIQLEPCDVYVGKNMKQVELITCAADEESSLNSKYFLLYTPAGLRYLVWFNVATAGVDPDLDGYTSVPVAIAEDANANAVATAVQTAIAALPAFTGSTVSGKIVTVKHAAEGYSNEAHDAQDSLKQTGFGFELSELGDKFERMGFIDGDITVSGLAQQVLDVTAHQTGTNLLAQLITGSGNPEMSFAVKEITDAIVKKLAQYRTGTYLPVLDGSTALTGLGTRGQFKKKRTTRVVLHPVSKVLADKSRDLCLWKATLDSEETTKSGENVLTLPVTVKGMYDCSKPDAISVCAVGDWSQIEAP